MGAMLPWRDPSHDEGICPICQEHLKEATSTECGHLFCRGCLTQHVQKALASDVLCCPLCRKPCPECILGIGLVCVSHQKRASSFCEESRCLLCPQCLESPEHKSHSELTIENAISHYKERLSRRSRKLRKDIAELQGLKAQEEEKLQALQVDCGNHWLETELGSQCQPQGQLDALSQQQLDQLEDTPAEVARILNLSRAIVQLSSLVTDLERTVKELDANTLKNAIDLLDRSAPQKLEAIHPMLEKRVSKSSLEPFSEF